MKKLPSFMRLRDFLTFAFTGIAVLCAFVTAAQAQGLAQKQVIEIAEDYVLNALRARGMTNARVEATPIDARIAIPPCPSGMVAEAKEGTLSQNLITVRVSCNASEWYLYTMVKVAEVQPVVVFNSSVSPGTLITADLLDVVEMDKKQLRTSTYAEKAIVIGARIKRRVRAGQPVVPGSLCFVCKGDSIVITAGSDGLEIKTSGVAQQDGKLGDTIAVKNKSSSKLIYATVTSPSKVSVRI